MNTSVRRLDSWRIDGGSWRQYGVSATFTDAPLMAVPDGSILPEVLKVTYDYLPVECDGNGKWSVAEVKLSGPSTHDKRCELSITWLHGDTDGMDTYVQRFVEENIPSYVAGSKQEVA